MFLPDRGAEQVDVIRHDDIAPDFPMSGRFPRFFQLRLNFFGRQNFLPFVRANGQMNDNRLIVLFEGRVMRWMFSVWMIGRGIHGWII